MDISKLYVPNAATLWIIFFKKKKRDTINQSDGGPRIVPINELFNDSQNSREPTPLKVNLVSPVEAATNRAEKQVKNVKGLLEKKL